MHDAELRHMNKGVHTCVFKVSDGAGRRVGGGPRPLFVFLTVCSGHQNKIPQSVDAFNIRNLFPCDSGGQQSKIKVLVEVVFPEASLGLQVASFLLCPRVASPLLKASLLKGFSPITLVSSLTSQFHLNDVFKNLSLNMVTLEVRASTYGFWEDTIQCITVLLPWEPSMCWGVLIAVWFSSS